MKRVMLEAWILNQRRKGVSLEYSRPRPVAPPSNGKLCLRRRLVRTFRVMLAPGRIGGANSEAIAVAGAMRRALIAITAVIVASSASASIEVVEMTVRGCVRRGVSQDIRKGDQRRTCERAVGGEERIADDKMNGRVPHQSHRSELLRASTERQRQIQADDQRHLTVSQCRHRSFLTVRHRTNGG